jgi:hypothetical protein
VGEPAHARLAGALADAHNPYAIIDVAVENLHLAGIAKALLAVARDIYPMFAARAAGSSRASSRKLGRLGFQRHEQAIGSSKD